MLWWTLRQLKSKNLGKRRRAAAALGKIGDERAVEPLIAVLIDSDYRVRVRAAEALGKIGDERAVEPLVACLQSERSGYVRSAAISSLEKLGWRPSTDRDRALVTLAEDKHSSTSNADQSQRVRIIRMCPISRDSILRKKLDEVDQVIKAVTEEVQRGGGFEPWLLTVSGFAGDSRALFDIPEVRSWCQMVHRKRPYFASMLTEEALDWYLFCLLDLEFISRQPGSVAFHLKSEDQPKRLLDEIANEAGKHFQEVCPVEHFQKHLIALRNAGKRIRKILELDS